MEYQVKALCGWGGGGATCRMIEKPIIAKNIKSTAMNTFDFLVRSRQIPISEMHKMSINKLAKRLLNAATLQLNTDRLVAAAKELEVDVVELADRLRQKYEQYVAFGSVHKRTFNWNDCTFYMSTEHAQAATGSGYPEKGHGDVHGAADAQSSMLISLKLDRDGGGVCPVTVGAQGGPFNGDPLQENVVACADHAHPRHSLDRHTGHLGAHGETLCYWSAGPRPA